MKRQLQHKSLFVFGATTSLLATLCFGVLSGNSAHAAPAISSSALAQNNGPSEFNPNTPFGSPAAPSDTTTAPAAVPAPAEAAPSGTSPLESMPGGTPSTTSPSTDLPGSGFSTPPQSLRGPENEGTGANSVPPGEGEKAAPDEAALQAAIKAGKELLQQAKYEEALVQFQTVVKGAPQEPLGYYLSGVAARLMDRYDDAIDAFSSAIDRLPDNDDKATAYLRRGIAWFNKGNYGIAWDDFDEAGGLFYDQEPIVELWKGLALAKQERWHDAVNSYAEALELNPKFVPAYINRGLAYLALNEPLKAAADFNQAIRRDPHNASSYFKLGVALSRAGKLRAAVNAYDEALRVKPDYAEAISNRSQIVGRLGEIVPATQDRSASPKSTPDVKKPAKSAG